MFYMAAFYVRIRPLYDKGELSLSIVYASFMKIYGRTHSKGKKVAEQRANMKFHGKAIREMI